MKPRLWNALRDWQLPWQWTAEDGTYIAGFRSEAAAVAYGKRNGWVR